MHASRHWLRSVRFRVIPCVVRLFQTLLEQRRGKVCDTIATSSSSEKASDSLGESIPAGITGSLYYEVYSCDLCDVDIAHAVRMQVPVRVCVWTASTAQIPVHHRFEAAPRAQRHIVWGSMISPILASPTTSLLRGAAHRRASAVIDGMRPWNMVKGPRYSNMPRQTTQRTATRFDNGQPTAEGRSGEQLLQPPFKQPSKAIQQRVGRVELIFGPMFAGKCGTWLHARMMVPMQASKRPSSQRPSSDASAGKSTALIRRIREELLSGHQVAVVKSRYIPPAV